MSTHTYRRSFASYWPFYILALLTAPTIFIPLIIVAYVILSRMSESYTITKDGVLCSNGIFTRTTNTLLFSNIESVSNTTSLIGQIFGYKTVTIRGNGGTTLTVKHLASGGEFSGSVYFTINRLKKAKRA